MTQNKFEKYFIHSVIVCFGLGLFLSSGCENSGGREEPVPVTGYAGPYTDDEDFEDLGFDDDVIVPSRPRPQVDSWQIRTMMENVKECEERIAEYQRRIRDLPPDAFLEKLHYLELIKDYEQAKAFGIGKLEEWGVAYL